MVDQLLRCQMTPEITSPSHLTISCYCNKDLCCHQGGSARMMATLAADGNKFNTWRTSSGGDGYVSTCLHYKKDENGATQAGILLLMTSFWCLMTVFLAAAGLWVEFLKCTRTKEMEWSEVPRSRRTRPFLCDQSIRLCC